jgi:hypothetical protein
MGKARDLARLIVNSSGAIDASNLGNAVPADGSITPPKLSNRGSELGMRNRIINGAMTIDQRNAGASVTPTNTQYGVDRWQAYLTQASKFSMQQSSIAPAGFKNSLLVTSLSSYSNSSGDIFNVLQFIEGFNVADLDWGTASAQPVTLSFWVRSSLTGTFGGVVRITGGGTRSYPFSYTISAANTFEYKTITIAGDTTGSWNTTNGQGVGVVFDLGVGSTFEGTAGAWANSNLYGTTGATSVVGTNNATWYITGVQLEKGTQATPFEHRPYGTELFLCQRYFESVGIYDYPEAGTYYAGWKYLPEIKYLVQKRATPTATTVYQSGWPNGAGGGFSVNAGTHSVQVIGQSGNALNNNMHNYGFNISAEL